MKNPVLIPFKLKFKDFIRLMLFILLVTVIALLTNNISVAQAVAVSTSQKFNEGLQDSSPLKKSDLPVSFDTYFIDSTFSIQVPDYLVKVTDLDDRASLQFKNIFNETYLMVIAEKKTSEGHVTLDQLQEHFEMNLLLNGGLLLNPETLMIDQYYSTRNEVEWIVNDLPMAYAITFIDTPDLLYKIYGWTLSSQKEYLRDFVQAADSFQTVKNHSH